ncbi:Nucleoside 5-triphosphatase RdgB (dHAPTP, dITP, XTP-specific) [hydrothermal vent metagenome]|uniref:dITP/XTP pyrophosphatase n=1 Tax=hydrothermal vent metagenome TaxID=652676 RepID=A0A3B1DTS2_9ZZZZ
MKVVLASRNKKKCGEIAALLQPYQFELIPVSDFPNVPDVVENGDTFAANAVLKATEVATATGCWAIGEDSGLQVDALEGAPGIYSARYSGEHATDERNNKKLIANLQDVPPEKRGAGYCCSIAVADATGKVILTVEATCRGRITIEPRGTNGFGYDPYFLIPEYHQTFGELTPLVKQHLSHRSRAFRKLIPLLLKERG